MMNHHLPAMNHGQPPIPPQRRQHEMPYVTGPPTLRSPPAYMGYPNGHMGHPMYPPQHHYQQPWYPYQPGPPHQRYGHHPHQPQPPMPQQPYAPFVVSSYPSAQASPAMAPSMIPPSMPPSSQPAPATPLQPPYSPASPVHTQPIPPQYVASSYTPGQYPPAPPPPMEPTPVQVETPQPVPETVKPFVGLRRPFYPELPWKSHADDEFPQRTTRRKRRARALSMAPATVQLPAKPSQANEAEENIEESSDNVCNTPGSDGSESTVSEVAQESEASAPAPEMSPMTSQAPSETATADSTQPTTPASTIGPQSSFETSRPATTQTQNRPPRPVIPVVPIVPAQKRQPQPAAEATTPKSAAQSSTAATPTSTEPATEAATEKTEELKSPPSIPAAPRLWADLVRNKQAAAAAAASAGTPGQVNGFKGPKPESLADVLETMGTDASQFGEKIAFLEPRGLVNTGNMCYMNSVLQVLVFCLPFYEFLDRIGRRAAHRFQSDSPLIEAMIMFLREFRVIDAAESAEQLRLRLKQTELEQYGEQFTPEYVYSAIRQLPRFRDMRRGHQQDAQEFLGFLLEELHEECIRSTKTRSSSSGSLPSVSADTAAAIAASEGTSDNGWLEVGHKQKAAVTRQSGVSMESPVTRIFGGKIRSEFRVPGNKTSVTLEPYQPLQLDIGAPEINNIIDALKGLTKPESIQGDFNSSRGANVNATKQVFLETLPPVLILHLKRFHYDNTTNGTQKIWKKIGYPLDLEIPREAFPPQRRSVLATQPGGLPKYKLVGVIYHHGKNASGGHYTVDVRRQDGKEWIRLDDTVIRRVRSEEVASAGSEEDPKVLAAALERHKHQKNNGTPTSSNMFEQIDNTDTESDKGWSQVNGATGGHGSKKSVSLQAQAATNGVSTPTNPASGGRTPVPKYSVKDNKVAYLLFYQRV